MSRKRDSYNSSSYSSESESSVSSYSDSNCEKGNKVIEKLSKKSKNYLEKNTQSTSISHEKELPQLSTMTQEKLVGKMKKMINDLI